MMTYSSPAAFREALNQRLRNRADQDHVPVQRLRRRLAFQRILARLNAHDPTAWVLKGGMALEVRLGNRSRTTKDIDIGLRLDNPGPAELHRMLNDALMDDPDSDGFKMSAALPKELVEGEDGLRTLRSTVAVALAGRRFDSVHIDISPRPRELDLTETIPLPNDLAFAGIQTRNIEIVDLNRHAAEKFHAITRTYGDRENSRVRDLVDIALLLDLELLDIPALAKSIRSVWHERENAKPPEALPPVAKTWADRYQRSVAELNLRVPPYQEAVALTNAAWTQQAKHKLDNTRR